MSIKHVWKFGIYGALLEIVALTVFLWFGSEQETAKMLTVYLAAGLLHGASCAIFFWDRLSLLVATVLHFALTLAVRALVFWSLGYTRSFWAGIHEGIGGFILIYAAIYLGTILSARSKLRRVNRKLRGE